ncbi:hypothetical protein S245_007518, partial [Arachis hypogaea]
VQKTLTFTTLPSISLSPPFALKIATSSARFSVTVLLAVLLEAPLPTPSDNREHSTVFVVERELKLLNFQLNNSANPSLRNNSSLSETGRSKGDFFESLPVKQGKKHISTPVPHDSYSVLSVSSSGKYVAIVWRDIPYFSVYMASDWSI